MRVIKEVKESPASDMVAGFFYGNSFHIEIVSIFVGKNTVMPQDIKPEVYDSSKGFTEDEFKSIIEEAFSVRKENPIVVLDPVLSAFSKKMGELQKEDRFLVVSKSRRPDFKFGIIGFNPNISTLDLKAFKAAMPVLNEKEVKTPFVFGTGGGIMGKEYHRLNFNQIKKKKKNRKGSTLIVDVAKIPQDFDVRCFKEKWNKYQKEYGIKLFDASPKIIKSYLDYLNDCKDPRAGKILSHLNRRKYVKFYRKLKQINENKRA